MDDPADLEAQIMETDPQMTPLSKSPTYLRVLDVLATLRRRDLLRSVFSGGGRMLSFLVSALLIRCLLDYWLHFSWTARAALLVADIAIAAYVFWRYFWKPFRRRLSRDGAALRLQAYAPSLRSRMIATVQLVPDVESGKAPRSLVEQLLMETAVELEEVKWKQSVPMERSLVWFSAALLLLALGAAWAFTQPAVSEVLIARYYLSNQGPILQTQLEVISGDSKLARGSDARLAATTGGEIPKQAVFQLIDVDGVSETFTVTADIETPGLFELVVENAQSGFRYRVLAGDARSREYSVEVLEAPTLRELNFEIEPPAYTGRPTYTAAANALRMIEGSTVSIVGQASDPLESAAIFFYAKEQGGEGFEIGESISLQVTSGGRELSAEVGGLSTLAGYIFARLLGRNGVESVNNTRYPIQWVMDSAPVIRMIQSPIHQSTVAYGRNVPISGKILEDYGLATLNFCYEIFSEGEDETPIQTGKKTVSVTGAEMTFAFRFVPGVGRDAETIEIEAAAGTRINWWLEAVDQSELPDGAHTTQSPKSTVKVITAEEKIAELMGSVQESLIVIEDASDRQIQTGRQLQQYIQQEKGTE